MLENTVVHLLMLSKDGQSSDTKVSIIDVNKAQIGVLYYSESQGVCLDYCF